MTAKLSARTIFDGVWPILLASVGRALCARPHPTLPHKWGGLCLSSPGCSCTPSAFLRDGFAVLPPHLWECPSFGSTQIQVTASTGDARLNLVTIPPASKALLCRLCRKSSA